MSGLIFKVANDYSAVEITSVDDEKTISVNIDIVVDENGDKVSIADLRNYKFDFSWVTGDEVVNEINKYVAHIDNLATPYCFLDLLKGHLEKYIRSLDDAKNIYHVYKKYKSINTSPLSDYYTSTINGNKTYYELDALEYYNNKLFITVTVTTEIMHSTSIVSCKQVSTLIIKHEIQYKRGALS